MRAVQIDSFNGAKEEFASRGYLDFLVGALNASEVKIGPGSTKAIRQHFDAILRKDGWVLPYRIPGISELEITAKKSEMLFQIQTGNISRYAYDLLKLQLIFSKKLAACACLVVPSLNASKQISGNLAQGERVSEEMKSFQTFITVPLLVLTFGE